MSEEQILDLSCFTLENINKWCFNAERGNSDFLKCTYVLHVIEHEIFHYIQSYSMNFSCDNLQ